VQFLLSTPTMDGRRRQVLDAGAGTGSWVREMAAMFPSVDFVGVDIVPVPPPPHIGPRSSLLSEESGEPSLLVSSMDEDEDEDEEFQDEGDWREEGEWDWDGGSETASMSTEPTPSYSWDNRGHWEEKPNVRFEVRDIIHGLGCNDNHYDIIQCRFVLTLAIPQYLSVLHSFFRALRPGGILLLAESSVPFCYSDDTDPPPGTAAAELIEVVRNSARDSGLDPDMRYKIEGIVRSSGMFEEVQVRDVIFPLGTWPKDAHMRSIGRIGRAAMSTGLRSLNPLLRQSGYDDGRISWLMARLHAEMDEESETMRDKGLSWTTKYLWARKAVPQVPIRSGATGYRRKMASGTRY